MLTFDFKIALVITLLYGLYWILKEKYELSRNFLFYTSNILFFTTWTFVLLNVGIVLNIFLSILIGLFLTFILTYVDHKKHNDTFVGRSYSFDELVGKTGIITDKYYDGINYVGTLDDDEKTEIIVSPNGENTKIGQHFLIKEIDGGSIKIETI